MPWRWRWKALVRLATLGKNKYSINETLKDTQSASRAHIEATQKSKTGLY
jgi:hypothetical protein